ncbi:MAG: VIT domain-containing protein, partial [Ferruginibacter sp.]
MQKLFLSLLFIITFIIQGNAQQRLFDQEVQLKNCSISIETNPFVATTVVEMEFYNPRNQEVEAYQAFELNNGQVITDFQLELNGKYREGSIEERWKARTAYSSIVGKRIDPALLQMNGRNRYSINIYPVAAKSSRKIKFTIIQMMKEENLKLSYVFPLNFKTITDNFNLSIKVNRPASIPYADTGFLQDQLFSMHNEEALFSMHLKELVLNKEISFSINQFANQPQFCINKKNGTTNFLMRFYPDMPQYYPAKPESIKVYWDVSLSGKQRNLSKELDFLETYISINEINRATVFLFNHEMRGIIEFDRSKNNIKSIRNYLLTYNYTGATDLGILNFSNVLADAVLVFSDGINSTGNARPKRGAVPVNFVTSSYTYYNSPYANLASTAGGLVTSLYYADMEKAIKKTEWSENYLFKYTASSIRINESFPVKLGGSILLSGTLDKGDNLELFYGNNKLTAKSVNYFLPAEANCDDAT